MNKANLISLWYNLNNNIDMKSQDLANDDDINVFMLDLTWHAVKKCEKVRSREPERNIILR